MYSIVYNIVYNVIHVCVRVDMTWKEAFTYVKQRRDDEEDVVCNSINLCTKNEIEEDLNVKSDIPSDTLTEIESFFCLDDDAASSPGHASNGNHSNNSINGNNREDSFSMHLSNDETPFLHPHLLPIATIISMFDDESLIIIQSHETTAPLQENTVLLCINPAVDINTNNIKKNMMIVGKVYEIFGPVTRPYYSVYVGCSGVNNEVAGSNVNNRKKNRKNSNKIEAKETLITVNNDTPTMENENHQNPTPTTPTTTPATTTKPVVLIDIGLLHVNMTIYHITHLSHYITPSTILYNQLHNYEYKPSDASNCYDEEPSILDIEHSDDEQEIRCRLRQKNQRKGSSKHKISSKEPLITVNDGIRKMKPPQGKKFHYNKSNVDGTVLGSYADIPGYASAAPNNHHSHLNMHPPTQPMYHPYFPNMMHTSDASTSNMAPNYQHPTPYPPPLPPQPHTVTNTLPCHITPAHTPSNPTIPLAYHTAYPSYSHTTSISPNTLQSAVNPMSYNIPNSMYHKAPIYPNNPLYHNNVRYTHPGL